jgi:ribosomal-protein-alanine N-acetyltransferase
LTLDFFLAAVTDSPPTPQLSVSTSSMMTNVRLATADDARDVAELSRSAVEHGLPWSWTPARVARAIADANTNVVVARSAGVLNGFGVMEYEYESAHLVLFAVDAPHRRKGLGSQLLCWLEAVAAAAGIARIHVESRADNAVALAFYGKHGYIEQEKVPGMYHGAEDGLRLAKRLHPSP